MRTISARFIGIWGILQVLLIYKELCRGGYLIDSKLAKSSLHWQRVWMGNIRMVFGEAPGSMQKSI